MLKYCRFCRAPFSCYDFAFKATYVVHLLLLLYTTLNVEHLFLLQELWGTWEMTVMPRRDSFCFGDSWYCGNGATHSLSIYCRTSLARPRFLKRWISAVLQCYKWGHGSHPEAAISSGSEIRAPHAQEIEEATHKGVCRQTLYGTPAGTWLDQIIHFWGCCERFTAN